MKRFRIAVVLGGLALLVVAGSVRADTRFRFPADIEPSAYTSPGGISLFLPGVIQDGEWAAIPFYRSPASVPVDFNLLDWFDPSLSAADCPFLLEGFGIWPGTTANGFPKSTQLRGLGAVPVWFVKLNELEAAMEDGEVTILELALLPSLQIGTADKYEEQLHWTPPHQVGHTLIAASGKLSDGRAFRFLAVEIDLDWNLVKIVFE